MIFLYFFIDNMEFLYDNPIHKIKHYKELHMNNSYKAGDRIVLKDSPNNKGTIVGISTAGFKGFYLSIVLDNGKDLTATPEAVELLQNKNNQPFKPYLATSNGEMVIENAFIS